MASVKDLSASRGLLSRSYTTPAVMRAGVARRLHPERGRRSQLGDFPLLAEVFSMMTN
jgi:hypothetical protein